MANEHNEDWSTYSRLVLKELERLDAELSECKREIGKLSNLISLLQQEVAQHHQVEEKAFDAVKHEIEDIWEDFEKYTKEVNEVWSPKQMQQVKNEVYRQKNQAAKIGGIAIAITVIINLLIAFKDQIFGN